jgi:hypothetical protein
MPAFVTMARRRARWFLPMALAAVFCFGPQWFSGGAHAQTAPAPKAAEFTDGVASDLLNQLTSGFTSRNQKKVLAAFDLAAMADGERFRQQIISFFSHTESVRIHFNLVKTSVQAGNGTAQAEVEMEAQPREDTAPPVHKQERLRFTAASTSEGWKFTDVQPRSFFSLQP